MLRLEEIGRTYRNGRVEARVLDGVSLEVARGEFVAITGPSGSGKSTLLHILGLLDRPTCGRYRFGEEEVAGAPESRLARLRNEAIGFVFQSFNLIEELSVAANVESGLIYRRVGGKERKQRLEAELERVGIAPFARLRPRQLSGGQQQRAAIARALISRPQVLLADEPTGNLDTESGEEVMALLRQAAAEGVTVIMVTHSPDHAAQAQRIVRLLDGRVVRGQADQAAAP